MVWFLLGAIYERQKFFDRAEEQFKKVLAVNPRNAPGAELLRLHARRSRHSPRRSRSAGEARAEGRALQRRVSRQPGLDLSTSKINSATPKPRCARRSSTKATTPPSTRTSAICTPRPGRPEHGRRRMGKVAGGMEALASRRHRNRQNRRSSEKKAVRRPSIAWRRKSRPPKRAKPQ